MHPLVTRGVAAAAAAAAMTVAVGAASAPAPTVIAALEQPPCRDDSVRVAVRPLFTHSTLGWTAIDSSMGVALFEIDAPRRWTVAFDGRDIESVSTVSRITTNYYWFDRDFLLAPSPTDSVPRKAAPSDHRFENWCGDSKLRTLVLGLNGSAADPDGWQPFTPAESDLKALLPEVRKLVPAAELCDKDDKPYPYHFTAEDFVVDAYRETRSDALVGITVSDHGRGCDGMGQPQNDEHWFVLKTKAQIGDSMSLLDAGDYDGDGHSEIIFTISGEDFDGYVLLESNRSSSVRRTWVYH